MSKCFPVRCRDNQDGNTPSRAAMQAVRRLVAPRHVQCHCRDPHCQHFGVPVRIHEQRRRGGSVQQQVAGGFPGAEVRQFHGLCCRFLHRETGQAHFGLADGRCPSTSSSVGRTKLGQQWHSLLVQLAAFQLTFVLVSVTTPTVGSPVTDVVQRLPSAVFTANQVTCNISDVTAFYEEEMGSSVAHSQSMET